MRLINKSERISIEYVTLLNSLLQEIAKDDMKSVSEFIICDQLQLDTCIKELDTTEGHTTLNGCVTRGKTLCISNQSIVIILSDIIISLINGITFIEEKKYCFNNIEAIESLKIILHEFGHAINNQKYGKLIKKREKLPYQELLNELWKILRNEALAEMNCAKLIKFADSREWFPKFNDEVEKGNFIYYLSKFKENNNKVNAGEALQLLHQYYFIPLFHKVGFILGLAEYLNIEQIKIDTNIEAILNCKLLIDRKVPKSFNDIVLLKWDVFGIKDILQN